MATRLSVNINDEARAFLEEAHVERNITYTDLINRALSVLKFVFDAEKKGNKIFVENKDGQFESVRWIW